MKVLFGIPENGWIKCEIRDNNKIFSDYLSYTPEDFISNLLGTLIKLSEGKGEYSMMGFAEPQIYEFIFCSDEKEIDFMIKINSRTKQESLFCVKLNTVDFLNIFFRAASKMLNSITKSEYEISWGHQIPIEKLMKLKSNIELLAV